MWNLRPYSSLVTNQNFKYLLHLQNIQNIIKYKSRSQVKENCFLIHYTESIITGCLPVAFNGAFSGVVCADILLSELVAEILYIKQEEFSYAFIIDGEERTLFHPLLPDPRDVEATDQDIINIFNFETAGDVYQVINSMKKKV